MTVLMPSRESLWIDEAEVFHHIAQPTFGALCSLLRTGRNSEALMPLGMVAAWVGGKVVGTGEWQMRAPNILWAALTVLAFVRLGQLWQAPFAPLLVAIQPFLWFYANEARPYALQIACGSWMAAGCAEIVKSRRVDAPALRTLLVASAALVATTLFGIVTVGAVAVILGSLCWRERWSIKRGARAEMALAVLWAAGFGTYYVWKLASGAQGAKLWHVGLQNLGFGLYEFAGFPGLGPGRDELRELASGGGVASVVNRLAAPADLARLALLAALLAAVGVGLCAACQQGKRRREISVCGGVCVVVAGATFALALMAHFPFWGRHLAPAFPFYCALLLLGIDYLWHSSWPTAVRIGAPTGLLALLTFSSAQLRWSPLHAKDDYRAAAATAVSALRAGRTVWWSADAEAAAYYGLALSNEAPQPGKATHFSVAKAERIAKLPVPDMIITSKRDINDPAGEVGRLITSQHFRPTQRFTAFTVWER